MAELWSGVVGVATAELDIGRIAVRSDTSWVVSNNRTSLVDFLGEDAIRWMQELGVATREDPIDLEVLDPRLEFGAELGAQSQALFLTCEIHDVFAGVHHGSTAGWQLKDLIGFAAPGDCVFLFC